jgi:phosphatidate cytidylyltransferase
MERIIYNVILIYFILGGIGFYMINRKKTPEVARKSYTKFGVYFIIINVLFFSITIQPVTFSALTFIIVGIGFLEISDLFVKSNYKHIPFFISSVTLFAVYAFCFLYFGMLRKDLILFTFLIVSIFDSFCQIIGQLVGRIKLLSQVSPNKTLEGLAGGTLFALITAFFLKELYEGSSTFELLFLTIGTIFFGFIGDALASLYKRKYDAKDYNNLIPGHGGFIDRFDSLITAGAWAAFYFQFIAI